MRTIIGKNKENHSMSQSFTLIEVLVVVAIIGILASLLLPVLGKARKKAQQAVCKSQLKQLYSAKYMFTDDNEGKLAASRGGAGHRQAWFWSVAPYLKIAREEGGGKLRLSMSTSTGVLKCPSNEIDGRYGTQHYWTGYAYPIYAGVLSQGPGIYEQVQIGSISSPVDAMLLGERNSYYFNPSGRRWEFNFGYYHLGRYNRLFADGHVGQGLQKQGFEGEPYYWYEWSFGQGQ